MGTVGKVQIWGLPPQEAKQAAQSIFAVWKSIDDTMSLYRPESDLCRVNAEAGGAPVRVSPDLVDILRMAREFNRRSRGLFDVRVGRLMDLWGLGVQGDTGAAIPPAAAEVQETLLAMQSAVVETDAREQTARISRAGVLLDLGGIAKGYALDASAEILKPFKKRVSAILDLGGQLLLLNPPAQGWKVGIREPGSDQRMLGAVTIRRSCSLATSSQADRFVETGGKRYGHVLNPLSGEPSGRTGSVLVTAANAVEADVLGKVLFLADEAQAKRLLRDFSGVEMVTVQKDTAGQWKLQATPKIAKDLS